MEKNVGDTEQIIRILLGAILGILSLAIVVPQIPEVVSLPEIASPILGILAIALLYTGFEGTCKLYSKLGINTAE
jgi:hypothetical protein